MFNTFGFFKERITDSNLDKYDPFDVIHALTEAKDSNLYSVKTKQIIVKIMKSIEPI